MRVLIPLFFVPARESRGQTGDHVLAPEPVCGEQGPLEDIALRTAGLEESMETFHRIRAGRCFRKKRDVFGRHQAVHRCLSLAAGLP